MSYDKLGISILLRLDEANVLLHHTEVVTLDATTVMDYVGRWLIERANDGKNIFEEIGSCSLPLASTRRIDVPIIPIDLTRRESASSLYKTYDTRDYSISLSTVLLVIRAVMRDEDTPHIPLGSRLFDISPNGDATSITPLSEDESDRIMRQQAGALALGTEERRIPFKESIENRIRIYDFLRLLSAGLCDDGTLDLSSTVIPGTHTDIAIEATRLAGRPIGIDTTSLYTYIPPNANCVLSYWLPSANSVIASIVGRFYDASIDSIEQRSYLCDIATNFKQLTIGMRYEEIDRLVGLVSDGRDLLDSGRHGIVWRVDLPSSDLRSGGAVSLGETYDRRSSTLHTNDIIPAMRHCHGWMPFGCDDTTRGCVLVIELGMLATTGVIRTDTEVEDWLEAMRPIGTSPANSFLVGSSRLSRGGRLSQLHREMFDVETIEWCTKMAEETNGHVIGTYGNGELAIVCDTFAPRIVDGEMATVMMGPKPHKMTGEQYSIDGMRTRGIPFVEYRSDCMMIDDVSLRFYVGGWIDCRHLSTDRTIPRPIDGLCRLVTAGERGWSPTIALLRYHHTRDVITLFGLPSEDAWSSGDRPNTSSHPYPSYMIGEGVELL